MRNKQFVIWAIVGLVALYALASVGTLYAAPAQRDCSGATVYITSPSGGQTVSGSVPIIGSANLPAGQFRYYKLEYAPAGTNAWALIADVVRRPVMNGVLATINVDRAAPGDYTLRLLAVDPTGNYCEALSNIHVGLASDTPMPTSTPGPSETPGVQGAAQTPGAPSVVQTVLPGTPTVVVDLPKNVPGADSIFTTGNGKSALPFNPADLATVGDTAGAFAGQLGHQFTFGMQAMAGLFILLGVIVFLRENL